MQIKYYNELDLDKISLEPLTDDNYHLVEGFSCGNIFFDEFLAEDALYEISSRIYLIVYDNNTLLGFFGLSSTGLTTIRSDEHNKEIFNKSAIEISFFAIDTSFQHMYFNEKAKEEKMKIYLSDIVFIMIISYIQNYMKKFIGIEFVVLYSVPEAVKFYQKHNFEEFDDSMMPSTKQYLSDCTPMVFKL